MKKKLILTIISLIVVVIIIRISIVNSIAKQVKEDPKDILYEDVIITALSPSIDKAIDEYYKNILTKSPFYDSTSIKILNIDRPNGNQTWNFIIEIEVRPYIGPHITVGKDRILIELSYPGLQAIKSFEHVEDYPLPERYKHLYLQ